MSTFRELRTKEPRFARNPPTSTPTTINMAVGAWTWAGVAMTFAAATVINMNVGAYTWAGVKANIPTAINMKVGAWSWAGTKAAVAKNINMTVGAYSWAGVKANIPTAINLRVGAYSWSGVKAAIATNINMGIGAWTWAGTKATFGSAIPMTVGAYTWAGVPASLGTNINMVPGSYTWSGVKATIAGTTPVVEPTGSGGGGRYFGYYPERAREVRAEIRSITKEKKRIERRFKLAPNNVDLARLAALLTELQQRLDALVTEYADLTQRSVASQDEDEEFLVSIFSESFYD
jgi:hypothetical protein